MPTRDKIFQYKHLGDLEKYFTQKGWYAQHRTFITIELEGGFEAFSGRASETWEYRWVIRIHEHEDMGIPAVTVKGGRFDDLFTVADRTLAKLKKEIGDN